VSLFFGLRNPLPAASEEIVISSLSTVLLFFIV